jgi:riboflavin transporter FmnP
MRKTKVVAFTALMAGLANVLSLLTVPVSPGVSVHFFQVAIFLCGILAGPWAGLIGGAIGGLYMSWTAIPFIVGGIAILGGASGLLARRFRPFVAGVLAWVVQAPYVVVTDYIWFAGLKFLPSDAAWARIITILILLTVEAIISAALAEGIIYYLKRAGISLQ